MIDWLNVLDIKKAYANCRADIYGDWYRDPWDWAELWWASKAGSDQLIQRLNSTGASRVALLDVAKENFILRPAVVLDPIDRLAYEALVGRLSRDFVGDVPNWVYGWRLDRKDPSRGHYAPRRKEWTLYLSDLQTLAEHFSGGLQTDIVSFFASVPLDQLFARIEQAAGRNDITRRLIDMLEYWGRIAGRSGLPQRCNASSILANMYLRPVDDVIREYCHSDKALASVGHDVAALRWMDDIWLFGDSAAHLRCAQMELQTVLSQLGLHMSPSKTELLEGDDLVAAAHEVEHSAVDQALSSVPADIEPLEQLVEGIVTDPERAPGTSIRFATVRMRQHELFAQVRQFVEISHRMPQGSPWLGRLFRDSGWWRDLDEWYSAYQGSEWGKIDWALAQIATMFPTHWGDPQRSVVDTLVAGIEGFRTIPVFAVGAQRLAAWNPETARRLFREAARRTGDPHQRRVLALAALNAGEEVPWVRRVLSEFEENAVTRAMLEDRRFSPVKASTDFEADKDDD